MIFIVYGFLGWCVEVIYVGLGTGHFYNRGFLHMPLLPIYAIGALLINISTQNLLSNPLLLFIVGVIVTSALEYITSVIMEYLFHTRWWDYSSYKFNINGRICLKNSFLFGLLCLFVMYGINPFVLDVIEDIPLNFQDAIANIFIFVFVIDLVYTLRDVSVLPIRDMQIISGRINAYKDGTLKTIEELSEELQDHNFGDGYIIDELRKYSKSHAVKKPILVQLLSIIITVSIIGLIVQHLQLFLLLTFIIILVSFLIYNHIKYYSVRKGSNTFNKSS